MTQKNYKKFVATAATATLVASALVPVASAAETKVTGFTDVAAQYKEAVDFLVANDITSGKTATQFGTAENILRVDSAIWIAKATLDAKEIADAPATEFTDVPDRGVAYVNALKEQGWVNGKTTTTLDSYSPITRGEVALILTNAYELTGDKEAHGFTDVNDRYAAAVAALKDNDITSGKTETRFGTNDPITRGELAIWLFKAAQDEVIEEVTAEVASINAINASELKVTFSAPVDTKTATAAVNYQLKINNNDIDSSDLLDIQLSEDGKTATILLDQDNVSFQNGDKYVIQTNDGILSKTGEKLEKFVSNELTFSETAAPSLVSVAKGGNSLTLTFDRPVDASAASSDVTLIKVDGIEIGSKDLKPVHAKTGSDVLDRAGAYQYTVAITDADAVEEAKKVGTHEVVIFDVADTAKDYKKVASVLTGSYTVTDTVIAPEVIGVEAVNANRFFVYTNTAVTLGSEAVITVNKGTHEFKADDVVFDGSVATADTVTVTDAVEGDYQNKPGIWVVVTDNNGNTTEENPLYRAGETAVDLTVTVEKYTADGLIGKKAVENVKLNKHNTEPVVETTTVSPDGKSLLVVFTNELVQLDGTTPLVGLANNDFIVRDKDGIILEDFTATVLADGKGRTVQISNTKDLKDDAPYTVEFKEGKFKNAEERTNVPKYLANTVKNNKIVVSVGTEAATNFKYTEFNFPAVTVTTGDVNSIEFKYASKMGDSARDVANYTLDGKALPAGTTADFVGDRQTVRVVFPKGTFKTTTQYKFGVTTNVKTETGSIIVGSLQTKAPAEYVFGVTDNVNPELASAVYYVDTDSVNNQTKTKEIEVTFNEAVTVNALNDATNDFAVVINGSRFEVTTVAHATEGDNTDRKLVLTLKDEINVAQAATITIVPEDEQTGTDAEKEIAIVDKEGNKAKEKSSVTATNYRYVR